MKRSCWTRCKSNSYFIHQKHLRSYLPFIPANYITTGKGKQLFPKLAGAATASDFASSSAAGRKTAFPKTEKLVRWQNNKFWLSPVAVWATAQIKPSPAPYTTPLNKPRIAGDSFPSPITPSPSVVVAFILILSQSSPKQELKLALISLM